MRRTGATDVVIMELGEVAAVERLRDLVCLATGVDIVEDEAGSCKLLWEICGWLDELIAILLRA